MRAYIRSRVAPHVQRLIAALLLLSGASSLAADDPGALLKRADSLRTANNTEFRNLLKQVDAQADSLTSAQRDYLDYLKAWQLVYRGDFKDSSADLQALIDRTQDATVRTRALITLTDSQALAAHYEEAYTNLGKLLETLPRVQDRETKHFGYGVASLLYNQAGQYKLAIQYADLWLADSHNASASCKAMTQKVEALYKLGKLHQDDPIIDTGIDACRQIGESLWANDMRVWRATLMLEDGHAKEALQLLTDWDAKEMATDAAVGISQFRSLMARAAMQTGDLTHAREYAQSAIDHANKQVYAKSVADAYDILYQIDKRQGDEKDALAFHEKYDIAKTGYLNDVSARALAYQMVHQQVLDKQRQIDAANDKNKMLALQQQVDAQMARARLLYIGLLLMGLAIVATWAWRTKRSQLRFQKLARVDSLTGIFNRQHFFDSAQDTLRYCARNGRPASLLALDLDHFKSVNDMHGHSAGDAALQRAVAACQVRLRTIDVFGRLGGEEFAILLPDCPLAIAAQRAEEMRQAIAASRCKGDAVSDVLVTASFGVAGTEICGYNLTTVLAQADNALYAAKHAGRNRVCTHDTVMAESAGT